MQLYCYHETTRGGGNPLCNVRNHAENHISTYGYKKQHAIAASIALPPARRTSSPASVAKGCLVTTIASEATASDFDSVETERVNILFD